MAISKIQYDDKVAINTDSTIPDINKCNASDLNEIKQVVNNNADEIPTISDEYGTSTTDGYSQNYINENTINPSGEPSTSEEDVSSATFTNTLEAPMNIDLKGNTLQNGTPTPSSPIPINNVSGDNNIVVCGKNLLNYDNNTNISTYYLDNNGNMVTGAPNTYINEKMIIDNTKSYSISFDSKVGTSYIRLGQFKSNGTFISRTLISSNTTFTLNNECSYILLSIDKNDNNYFTKIMLNEGSTATTYEAYNGTTYNIDLPVDNLMPNTQTTQTINGITLTNNNDGTYSLNGTATAQVVFQINPLLTDLDVVNGETYTYSANKEIPTGLTTRLEMYNGTSWKRVFISDLTNNTQSRTATLNTTDANIIRQSIIVANGVTINIENIGLMLEKGSKVNSFTPYGTTPIELNKIGTYQDYFYKENNKWYLHKEIGKVVLDGTENWQYYQNKMYLDNVITDYKTGNDIICISNYYQAQANVNSSTDVEQNKITFRNSTTSKVLYIYDTRYTTTSDFTTWLSTNNTIVYYILATPTNTEITYTPLIEQLESIKNAMSKEGTTNVNQVNNDAPFMLDLSVFNDTYNGRYESLVERIPSKDNLVNVGTYVNDNYKINMLYSHNLFDKNTASVGQWLNANGTLSSNSDFSTSDFIPIVAGEQYYLPKTNTRRLKYYNSSKTPLTTSDWDIASGSDNQVLTIPNNASYVKITIQTNVIDINTFMFNKGSTALPYEPYVIPSINVDGEEIYNASKDVISIIGNPNYTISTSGAYEKVPLNIISSQIGNNFSLNNSNQIVCKKNGYIKINANINYTSINTSGVKWAGVFINNNNTITTNSYGVASQRLTLSITTFLIKVNANDVIDIRVYGNQGDTIRNDNFAYTYLTCEYV